MAFLKSSWSFILIVVVVFFLVEITESLFAPMLEGANEINNALIDAFISIIILSPFIWWLVKNTDRFEEELKENEERFRTLFESAPDAIFLADPETGIIIDANSRASELIRRPREEIIGIHQAQLHPPRMDKYSRESFSEHTRKMKIKEDIRPFENFVLRPDGTEVPVEVLAQMVTIKGRPVIQEVFRDITGRKRTEDILRKSKESFSKAEKIGHFGYWEWDIATNKLIWSDEVFRLYGLDPQKVTPTYETVVSTLSAEARDWFIKAIDDALNENAPFEGEYSLIRPDGTMRYTHTIGEVVRDSDGKPLSMFGVVQDITERKQVEGKLQLFRNLLESSNDAIFVNDPETGRILDANDRACISLGYTRNELFNLRVFDFEVSLPEKFSWKDHVKEVQNRGHLILEGRHRRKEGTTFPVEVNVSFVIIGKISYMLAVVRDITERKQAEEALRENKEFSEKLIDSLADGLSVMNKDGVRVMVNKSLCDMTGFSEDELINSKPPFQIWPPEHMKKIRKTFKTMMQGTMSETEMVFMRKTGERFPVLVSPSYMRDECGEITNFINSIKDITERKAVEEELLKFKLGIERSDEAIFITNSDGSIINVNPAFEKMYGYSREEALGKTPRILKSGLLPSEAYKPFWDTLLAKKVVNGELVNKTKDGRLLNIGGSANPILNDDGNIVGFLAIQRDITEAKRIEKEKERLIKAIDCSTDGIAITDGEDRFIYVNAAHAMIYGYPQEELIGKTWREVTIPEMIAPTEKAIYDILHNKDIGTLSGEFLSMRKDGIRVPTEVRATAFWDENGNYQGHICIVRDLTECKRGEEELNKSHKMLDAINRAQSQFIKDSDSQIIFDDLLKNLLTLTNSEYGLIGEVLYNTKGEPYLKIHAITNIAWNNYMKEFYEKNAPKGMEFYNLKTLFNAVITTGKPVISNDPSSDPRRGGLPKGHPLINSFLGLPFYRGEKLVGLFGIANRPGGYEDELVEYLKPILSTCANIIEAYRTDQKRKLSEEQIKSSLKEKEILLREIHHRVKNNMQIISSLLGLQAESIKEKKYLDMINDSRNRIISMYIIHEKLYRSSDLEKIEFNEYIRDLANGLLQSHGVKPGTIELNINVKDTSIGIDFAIPCGLIINELITNSLKYAFPDGRKGKISVSLHPLDGSMFELVVSDNGAGIPPDVDFRKTESLGLRLVTILAENQLQGKVDLNRNGGTEFTIKFKGVK